MAADTDTDQIQFVEHHKPALLSGDYRVVVEQQVFINKQPQKFLVHKKEQNALSVEKKFSVRGERFKLDESEIDSCFPPNESEGAFIDCLPHIVLKSATLPWERRSVGGDSDETWLALLLFDEDEVLKIRTDTRLLRDFDGKDYGKIDLEAGEHNTDKCNIIEVPENLFKKIVPRKEDLKWLAHIRKVSNEKKESYNPENVEAEFSVVVGNRIPLDGKKSTVHLVSLEGYYDEKSKDRYEPRDGMIQLVTLKKWRFTLAEEDQTFGGIAKNLKYNSGAFRCPTEFYKLTDLDKLKAEINSDIVDKLEDLKNRRYESKGRFLRAVKSKIGTGTAHILSLILEHAHKDSYENTLLKSMLSMGYTLMPHQTRQGDRTVSMYRGPFIPYHCKESLNLPVPCSDELIRLHRDAGMFDVSYAAAWQLGRLLSIEDRNFSMALFKWKRLVKQETLIKGETKKIEGLLGDTGSNRATNEEPPERAGLEKEINAWLGRLKNLTGVPFNYLVPDEKMLPQESIKFFTVDMNWINCLVDGAFSVGRVTSLDKKQDEKSIEGVKTASDQAAMALREGKSVGSNRIDMLTGVLVRSGLISGWPGLEFDGYGDGKKLPIFGMRRLEGDILLCMFEGDLQQVDIHLPPEGLRFSIRNNGAYYKQLRDPSTGKLSETKTVAVSFRPEDMRVLDVAKLATDLKTETSAQFAIQMVESADKISFKKAMA